MVVSIAQPTMRRECRSISDASLDPDYAYKVRTRVLGGSKVPVIARRSVRIVESDRGRLSVTPNQARGGCPQPGEGRKSVSRATPIAPVARGW
jgi:hypothetical protein